MTAAVGQRCILALDFDGVMHPTPTTDEHYLFCRLDLFQTWLRERPLVDVVISSSWREVHPFDEMRSYFREDLQSRIVGTTPVLKAEFWTQASTDRRPVYERETEVRQWLRANGLSHRPWVALDDQASLFKPLCEQLVLCDGRIGLTSRELDLADAALARLGTT